MYHKEQEINTSRLRNDNNNAQTKYTHGVAVNLEPQKVKERVKEEIGKRSLKGLVFIINVKKGKVKDMKYAYEHELVIEDIKTGIATRTFRIKSEEEYWSILDNLDSDIWKVKSFK